MDLKNLRARHKEILRRILMGQSYSEISSSMGVSTRCISLVANSRLGREYLEQLSSARDQVVVSDPSYKVRRRISSLAEEAVSLMEAVVKDPSSPYSIRVKAAMDLLDRAGLSAPRFIHSSILHGHLTLEDIQNLKKRAQEVEPEAKVLDIVQEASG